MNSTPESIIREFETFSSWEDKYKHIIELGKNLPEMKDSLKTDDNKVRGCQSQVWLHARLENGKVLFEADSDALIVKGLIALLLKVYSNRTPKEILSIPPNFIEKLGLNTNLSQTRANGLVAMIKQIKFYALAYSSIKS